MFLNELAAWRDLVAHQNRKGVVYPRLVCLVEIDLEHLAALGIHRRFPKLLGIHFTQALVTLDCEAAFPGLFDLFQNLRDRVDV